MDTHTVAVILARAGSRGLRYKNVRRIAGRPMIEHTIRDACEAKWVDTVLVSTDLASAAESAREFGVQVINRPAALATDTATVDSAARHAIEHYEETAGPVSHVALLYGNVPVRSPRIIDRTLEHLITEGCDSVRSMSPVEKQHPDWLHAMDDDKLRQFRTNSIYRRQDLEPLFYHDGAVVAVTRESLFTVDPSDPHAFFGQDRRGVISQGGPTVDVDSIEDAAIAEAILKARVDSLTTR